MEIEFTIGNVFLFFLFPGDLSKWASQKLISELAVSTTIASFRGSSLEGARKPRRWTASGLRVCECVLV